MKRVLSLAAILLVIAAIIGCEKPQPEAPTLIEPEDGAVFDTLPPTFIWSSDELAEGYIIESDRDTFGLGGLIGEFDLLWEYTSDTSCTMKQAVFNDLENTIYYWHVASFWVDEAETLYTWSNWRSFVVDKPPEPGDPSPPELISPENDAVFDTSPPTFVWGSDSLSKGYFVRIWTNSTTEVEDSMGDTTYAMSQEFFDDLAEGTYNWAAATVSASGKKFWSEARTFTITRPEPVTDLDTTYFPLGLGYEWCFERYERSEGDNGEGEVWDYERFDTFTVTVTDSFWEGDTMCFTLETEKNLYQMLGMLPYCHWDLYGEARVNDDRIYLVIWMTMVDLVPDPTSLPDFMSYRGDTLYSSYDYWDPHTTEYISVRRLRGIGILSQTHNYWFAGDTPPYPYEELYETDRLLYFYNGEDTLYDASQSEAFRSSAHRTSRQD